jgi:ATP-dependent RNA helicase DeaD
MSDVTFADLGLNEDFLETLAERDYVTPTKIQEQSIPALLEGKDLLGVSQTGSGKTAAFLLPLLQRLEPSEKRIQIIVLAPTRELGIQVARAMEDYAGRCKGFSVACLYGGQDIRIQLRDLKRQPQAIVATPGRMLDHLKRGSVRLEGIRAVVLDEADEMLKMGFIDDVNSILESVPDEAQMALFSATMPREIQQITESFLSEPVEVKVDQGVKTVDRIEQRYLLVKRPYKKSALERIIEAEDVDAGIIFVKTKQQTIEVSEALEKQGVMAAPLNGDLQQNMREATIRQLKEGHIDWVVATDVAARGLDVQRITHVINYEIPFDNEAYVHRIGRTGRAGRHGVAILMLSGSEMRQLARIERHTGAPIAQMELPGGKEISDKRIVAFCEKLLKVIGQEDHKRTKKLMEKMKETHDLDPMVIAAALVHMASEERPLYPKLDIIPEEKARKVGDRSEGKGRNRRERAEPSGPQQRYRLAVGKQHRVGAGDIVGALANEGGIPSSEIGNIRLYHNYSTVDLPTDIPAAAIQEMSRIRVRSQLLGIRPWSDDGSTASGTSYRKSESSGSWKGGGGYRKNEGSWKGGEKKRDASASRPFKRERSGPRGQAGAFKKSARRVIKES